MLLTALALLGSFLLGWGLGPRIGAWLARCLHRWLWPAVVLALATPLAAQTLDTTVIRVPYLDSVRVPVYRDSVFTAWRDSLVITPRPGPPPDTMTPPPPSSGGPHEPAGLTPIIQFEAGPTKLPTTPYITAPGVAYGLVRGKARSEPSVRVEPVPYEPEAPNGWAHRCWFGKGSQAGRGVGCTLFLKEALAGNTDGATVHSYGVWYERGTFRFGNVTAAATIDTLFESPNISGLKLLGYWGFGQPGNVSASQAIGWAAPRCGGGSRTCTGAGRPQHEWVLEWRWNDPYGRLVLPRAKPHVLRAGVWHTYEIEARINSQVGAGYASDGVLRVWLDGQLVIEHLAVNWRDARWPRGFFGRHWNPVQGGGCPPAPLSCTRSVAGALDIGRVYVAVGQPVD